MENIELEKLFELFDKALTSKDERVVNALRSLLMIATLTEMGDPLDETAAQLPRPVEGPLKQLLRKVELLEQTVRNLDASHQYKYDYSSPGYGATRGAGGSPYNYGAGMIGDLTLTGIDYSTAGTYTTVDTCSPSLSIDTITLTDTELENILKGVK